MGNHQVTDVASVPQSYFGVGCVDLDAMLNIGDQLLAPVDHQGSPVNCHVLYKNLDEPLFVD